MRLPFGIKQMGLFKFFIGFSETESTNFSSARAGPFKIAKPY